MSSAVSPSRGHIKRPMNSFMVWSREKRCDILKKHPGINNAVVSKTLGAAWKSLTEEEKKPYVYEAQRLAEQHRDDHPEYKYRPRRRKTRVKTVNSLEESAAPVKPMQSPNRCMCHTQSPQPDYPELTRCPAPPSHYPYPPFYGYMPPGCCPREMIPYAAQKTNLEAFLEQQQQQALRYKPAHYNHDYDMKYQEAYKQPCTRGCCSPMEEHLRYYRYAPYAKETMPR